jgi:hypothetical protein
LKWLYTGKVYGKFPRQKVEFIFFATAVEAPRLYNAILNTINKTNGLKGGGGADFEGLASDMLGFRSRTSLGCRDRKLGDQWRARNGQQGALLLSLVMPSGEASGVAVLQKL